MSSLHENLSRRRAAEPTGLACVTTGTPQPGLLVTVWSGGTWVLPWSYLVNARFTEPPGELELSFTSHVVLIEGDNLSRLLDDLAGFRIGSLRDLPENYRAQFGPGAVFIRRLVVRPAARSEKSAESPDNTALGTEKSTLRSVSA